MASFRVRNVNEALCTSASAASRVTQNYWRRGSPLLPSRWRPSVSSSIYPGRRSCQQSVVHEFGLVGQDVRVCVRRDGEVPLSDVLADPRPWNATQALARLQVDHAVAVPWSERGLSGLLVGPRRGLVAGRCPVLELEVGTNELRLASASPCRTDAGLKRASSS